MPELEPITARSTTSKKTMKAARAARKPRKPRVHKARIGVPPPLSFDLLRVPASAKLTIPEIAAAVRRSAQTVRLWATQPNHPIKFHKVDGRTMATVGDVVRYLNTPQQVSSRGKPKMIPSGSK